MPYLPKKKRAYVRKTHLSVCVLSCFKLFKKVFKNYQKTFTLKKLSRPIISNYGLVVTLVKNSKNLLTPSLNLANLNSVLDSIGTYRMIHPSRMTLLFISKISLKNIHQKGIALFLTFLLPFQKLRFLPTVFSFSLKFFKQKIQLTFKNMAYLKNLKIQTLRNIHPPPFLKDIALFVNLLKGQVQIILWVRKGFKLPLHLKSRLAYLSVILDCPGSFLRKILVSPPVNSGSPERHLLFNISRKLGKFPTFSFKIALPNLPKFSSVIPNSIGVILSVSEGSRNLFAHIRPLCSRYSEASAGFFCRPRRHQNDTVTPLKSAAVYSEVPSPKKYLYTVTEAAKFIGVSADTLRNWEEKGKLIPQRTKGGSRRYRYEQLKAVLIEKNPNLARALSLNDQLKNSKLSNTATNHKLSNKHLPPLFIGASFAALLFLMLSSLVLAGYIFQPRSDRGQPPALVKIPFLKTIMIDQTRNQLADNNQVLGSLSSNPAVLAEETAAYYLEINSDTAVNGGLGVSGDIVSGTGIYAPNILYGLTAGDNITISSGQNPTISASVSLTAGTGISISGGTITNSDLGSAQKIFKTIKLGSDSFSAGSSTDTLEFVAGSGTSLSLDTTNKKLTIAGSNLGGWTDDGSVVRLSTATDTVGIGTASPNASSILDLTSTTKGLLTPRMTTAQRDAISSPATGLMVYNTSTSAFNVYGGSSWGAIGGTFTLSGDSGTSQTISGSDTMTISGGSNGIDTVASDTDTLTLNFDATEVGTVTWGAGSSLVWTFNAGATDPTIDFNSGGVVFNEGGSDVDFRIEGDNNANLLTLDAGLFTGVGQLSIGSAAQSTATAFMVIDNPAITATSTQNFYKVFIDNNAAATVSTSASLFASLAIDEPNISGTPTNAATLYITDAPTEGSSGNFAIWVDNGESRFENLPVSGSTTASALTVVPSYIVEDTNLTLSGVRIALDTNSNTDSGDTAYGLNIDDISTAAGPTEYALRVGSGYDYQFLFELGTRDLRISATAPSAGTSPLTATIPAIAADDTFCLSSLGNCFGSGGGLGVTYTSQTTNAITKFTSTTGQISSSSLTDDGTTLTLAANLSMTMTTGTGSITQNFSPVGTTSTARAFTITPTFGIDVTDQTLAGLYINPNTNTNTDTGDLLSGIHIADITASSALESAIKLGSGWDNQIYFTDTTTVIKIANGGSIVIEDDANGEGGDGNDICTITDGGNLTCTGSISGGSSGTQGYWSRTSTTLSPATANDVVSVTSIDNTNATLSITNNTANTIGAAASLGVANLASTSLTTGALLNLQLTEGTLSGGYYLRAWDATAGSAVFSVGEDGNTTIAGAEGSTMFTLTAGDAAISDGSLSITDDDDAVSLGVTNNTATTIGAGINTAGVVDLSSTSLTTGNLMNLETTTALTSGRVLNVSSTTTSSSFSGNLGRFSWEPGSATTATADLFLINIGANGTTTGNLFDIEDNTSSLFSVSETQITSSLPHQFSAPGDVSMAYDLQFTNPTASYIKSQAPLSIEAGEVFNSSDLTLKTWNQGSIILAQDNTVASGATSYGVQILSNLIDNAVNPTTHYSLYNVPTVNITGDTLTTLYGNYIGLTNTAGTITTLYGNYVAAPTGSGTVTTNYGMAVAALSNATSYGLDIGALSGATANYGVNIGAISGAGTSAALTTGANSATGATAYQLNLGAISGANATSHTGINIGNISGTTAAAAGITLGTLTGGTSTNYQINAGNITAIASATNAGINLGTISGTAASSSNYGVKIGAISSTGTLNTGLDIGALSGAATTNTGINIGNISAATGNNYGILLGTLTGGTGSSVYGIKSGTLTSVASGTNYQMDLGAVAGATSATFGAINTGAISGAGTTSYGINLGANSATATTNYGLNIGAVSGAGTNNYGLNIGAVSGAGTGNYSIYTNAGTAGLGGNVVANNSTVVSGTLSNTTGGTCGTQSTSTTLALLQTATAVTSSHILYNSTRTKHARVTSVTTCTDGAAATWQVITLTDAIGSQIATDAVTVYNPVSDLGTSSAGFFNNVYGVNGMFVASTVTGGFDIAEQYPTKDASIEAGDIVVIAGETKQFNPLISKSGQSYDKKVLGIISTNPGITLGDEQDNNGTYYKKVALSGRVPVKVSTENGAVEVGDYLTTSSIPGVAMKATKSGEVIGKALETFNSSFCHSGLSRIDSGVADTSQNDSTCQGKILVFIQIGFADPQGFLANIAFDSNGNIINKVEGIDPLSLAQSSVEDIPQTSTLTNQISQLEQRISSLEALLAAKETLPQEIEPILGPETPSTPSAQVAGEATSSSVIANNSPSSLITLESSWSPPLADDRISSASAQLDSIASLQNDTTSSTTDSGVLANTRPQNDITLTDPSILLATDSTSLSSAYPLPPIPYTLTTATIQESLKSLGETFLGNTIVAGDFSIDGTMSMSGNSLNVIGTPDCHSGLSRIDSGEVVASQNDTCGGILYLQSSPLAQGVDIFNGLVTIDNKGNLTAQTITAKEYQGIKDQSVGSGQIPAGQKSTFIINTQVGSSSKILITPTTLTSSPLVVTWKGDGQGFTVSIANTTNQNITFDWFLIGEGR